MINKHLFKHLMRNVILHIEGRNQELILNTLSKCCLIGNSQDDYSCHLILNNSNLATLFLKQIFNIKQHKYNSHGWFMSFRVQLEIVKMIIMQYVWHMI